MVGWIIRSCAGLGLVAQVLTEGTATAAPRYEAVDLAAAVGSSAVPVAIDDEGVVAMTGFTPDGQTYSLLYDVKTGSVSRPFAAGDRVQALSDHGKAAGVSGTNGCWLLSEGIRTPVPLNVALGVNDRGQVVGFARGFFPLAEIFDAASGTLTTLTLGGLQSVAAAINARGQVAGSGNPPNSQSIHAFRWSRGAIQDLGALGGDESFGAAIDRRGRVAGTAALDASTAHAFLFDGREMRDLGTLSGCLRSSATAMNDHGQVVGYADLCGTGATRAFVLTGHTLHDLNSLAPAARDGFVYARPAGVNDEGTIVGLATSPDGFSSRPFLLVRADDGDDGNAEDGEGDGRSD